MRLLLAPALLAACAEAPLRPLEAARHPAGGDADTEGGDGPTGPGSDAGPSAFFGVWSVTGTHSVWGPYQAETEIREDGSVVHVARFTSASFEGDDVAQAWTGTVTTREPLVIDASLRRAGFMTRYGGVSRPTDPAENGPLAWRGAVQIRGSAATASFAGGELGATETWSWSRASTAQPIWREERTFVAAHEPMPEGRRSDWWGVFESFRALPTVAPYVNRPEFTAGIHGFVRDRTDFAFYRQEPEVLRVIQSVIDPVSLAETRLRRRGFAHRLADKAAAFDAVAPARFLNAAGMFANWLPTDEANGVHIQSGDALLWTGVYLTSQALRFMVSSDPAALENVRRTLDAMFICVTIAGDPAEFCRSLRPHTADGDANWRRGAPPYDHLDWLYGGNNDMAHGLALGFLWGSLALRHAGGDPPRQQRIRELSLQLLDHSPVIGDGRLNEMKWNLFLLMLGGGIREWLRYEALYSVYSLWVVDQGMGTLYEEGLMLDSSGAHLNIVTLLCLWRMAVELDSSDAEEYRAGMRQAFDRMRRVRLGLYHLITGGIGFDTPPPEVDDAIWMLREYPLHKQDHDYDHRIRADFSLSPWPFLPWKDDWETNDRTSSLVGYPLFERNPDTDYVWKGNPMVYRGAASPVVGGNADFLMAYWLGRYYGLVDPDA